MHKVDPRLKNFYYPIGVFMSDYSIPKSQSRIRVVLVHPEDPANVGSVCRAIASMGGKELWIVGEPYTKQEEFDRLYALAMHGRHIYEQAKFGSLKDALRDVSWSVGMSRRHGKMRQYHWSTPPELVHSWHKAEMPPIALVFGRESSGLSGEELAACSMGCHIPTDPSCPSLNLSQAVQIMMYQFSQLPLIASGATETKEAHREQALQSGLYKQAEVDREALVELAETSLRGLDFEAFFKQDSRMHTRDLFLRILSRANLCEEEYKRLLKIAKKLEKFRKVRCRD